MAEPGYSYIGLCSREDNCSNYILEVSNAFQSMLKQMGLKVAVRKINTVCSGHCKKGVFVDIGGSVFYDMVKPADVPSIIKDTLLDGDILPQHFFMEHSVVGDEKVIYDRPANVLIYTESGFCLAEGLRNLLRKDGLSSCGKCVPCRIGIKKLDQLLSAFLAGKARVSDVQSMSELPQIMDIASRCALVSKFIAPLKLAMDHFGEELNFVCVLSKDSSRTCGLEDRGRPVNGAA